MAGEHSLTPKEAAYIAANAYFTLQGWDATYKFNQVAGANPKNAPSPIPGLASNKVVRNQVTGSGPQSLRNTGLNNGKVVNSFSGSSGSNMLGRTNSGFGYILKFQRSGKNHLVFATRGTRPEMGYPDLLTDFNMSLGRYMPEVGPVHSGFFDVYKSLLPAIKSAQSELDAADIIHCVGHSLGGAVANLVAINLAKKHRGKIRLYTYGAPRVGLKTQQYDKRLANILGEDNIFRVSHNFDLIPMIPVAPYIHVHPDVKDKNNFFIGSPVDKIGLENHDTNEYIRSVGDKTWESLRADKLEQGYLDKQYFNSWRTSDSWFKRQIGAAMNVNMAIMQRILQGLIDSIGRGLTGVATILDLFAIAIREGVEFAQVGKSYIKKFLNDCISMFNMGVDVTKAVLRKLLTKLTSELAIMAKQAMKRCSKIVKSKEFNVVLKTAATGSIGLLLM
jgi:hypothetical protein